VKFRKDIAVEDGKSAGVPGHFEGKGLGGKSGTLRAAIFGANDGLVSNLSSQDRVAPLPLVVVHLWPIRLAR